MTKHSIELPAYLRNQLLDQFRTKLPKHLAKKLEPNQTYNSDQMFILFDQLDEHIGIYWPLIATSVWHSKSQVLATAYFQTCETVLEAMVGLMDGGTFFLPLYTVAAEMNNDGMILRIRPTIECADRHWHILYTLIALGLFSVVKPLVQMGSSGVILHSCIPDNQYSESFERLIGCDVSFANQIEQAHTFYPRAFLSQRIGTPNKVLRDVLLQEIRKQARYHDHEHLAIMDLRNLLFSEPRKRFTLSEASSKIGIPVSTMKRYLAHNGETYTTLRTIVLREQVLIHLSKGNNTNVEAESLGFKSERSLSLFCKQQFGKHLRILKEHA